MSRLRLICACGVLSMTGVVSPVLAAGTSHHSSGTNGPLKEISGRQKQNKPARQSRAADWSQRDTAIYVVSTLNLVHTSDGHSLPDYLRQRMRVTRYDVYGDTQQSGEYFVQLVQASGSVVGTVGYQMGWLKPRSVDGFATKLSALQRSPDAMVRDYRSDDKLLLASFDSTLPS